MKQALRAFMKRPTTWVGIITALTFQMVFSLIWMTGYDGVTDRADQLHIAIVNKDGQLGKQVASNLMKELPFQMSQLDDLDAAKKQLDDRKLQMVIYMPEDFTQKTASPEGHANIQYWINESNPALIKSMMSGVAEQVTAEVNKQAVAAGIQSTLGTAAKMPEAQAATAAQSLAERVTADIQSTNAIHGMNNQMVPMMMVLASYVGAMIMGMNLEQSAMAVQSSVSRWRRFAARSIINIAAAVVVSLVGATLLYSLGGQIEQGFIHLWLFEMLFLLTFMFVSQMFLYLFGMAGMLFNIMLLSAQLVSSGTIVPRELLSDFYTALGTILPATYAVEGNMNLLFGGPGVGHEAAVLFLISAVAIAVSAAAAGLKRSAVQPHEATTTVAAK
ncbi:YhgE/Pip N-terminal domain-containing protein [Paenibacillus catalpae]|uniref:YhgE/Pip N-terminal domain-containing protein n=1 Tax=Paenibacillus catalpae TaxID=1045775 RepID=A0A1I2HJL0_9BACL|nr:ABC transporter permease [Paenibacillus catalpae]SFF28621.1 YhgE/Pip N-terminal domain-containing protein [Paenibacillus catalpae]